ncbi:HD family hydrolase [Salaquimonas pukyongi]|uniref:HD family hydrolase n=1 Tax=Salaquimonas pukyongi TaxID=2712698 RepID=UPI00096BA142|nr:HD family hydrolase [Salaquimonas pukyongi]
MLSGRRLDLLEPSPLDVEIEDIAQGLSRVARWNGQTRGDHAFSVAQHSLLVLDVHLRLNPRLAPAEQMVTLLHDAPEYVVGDMISPFKAVVGGDYKAVEHRLLEAIHMRFSLPAKTAAGLGKSIKKADTIAAYFEATLLAGFGEREARRFFGRPQGISPDGLPLMPWPAKRAQANFLKRFRLIEEAGLQRSGRNAK